MRDTSKDGFRNKLRSFVLGNFEELWRAVEKWDWLAGIVNRFLIDTAVRETRSRPHPWSTVSDYTSWRSLTDKTWSARHLPAQDPAKTYPAPEEVTALFRRPAGAPKCECPKSTLLFPVFAQYLTDGFLRTDPLQRLKNTSNHDIDLSPLYGRTAAQTDVLRLKSENPAEWGRLKSEKDPSGEEYPWLLFEADGKTVKRVFDKVLEPPLGFKPEMNGAEQKIFAVGGDRANATPQVSMLNTLLLREHNRLAGILAQKYAGQSGWCEERVFQTARNILIVIYIKIVIQDYINHISSAAFRLRGEPKAAWRAIWNRPNWITVEFNLLYRWHPLMPDSIRWGDRDVPISEMRLDNRKLLEVGLGKGFAALCDQPASAIGLFNTSDFLLPVETLSINQGRDTRLRTYNDYREAMGLQRVTAFNQITGDPARIAALERVYGRVEEVEFFVGLFSEDIRLNTPMPTLIGRMVAIDAFSQALTNPLLSEHVYKPETFTQLGWDEIMRTTALADVIRRNTNIDPAKRISMTRSDWKRVHVPWNGVAAPPAPAASPAPTPSP